MDSKDLARDTSGAKSYATFLAEVGDRVPQAVLPTISTILSQLDGEVGLVLEG